jgi:nucleotide-binding universal stress UspA family protein
MFKHLLVPTDGSRLSRAAAATAVRLARKLGARVTAFYAAPAPTPTVLKSLEGQASATRQAARAFLGSVEKAAKAAGVRCSTTSVTSDFPAEAIVAAAQKHRCDLIFIASRGRRGLRRASLLGSETEKVLSRAPVPVLVYRR